MWLLTASISRPACPSTFGPVADDLLAAAHQWQSEGWALVDGLVQGSDVDAVAGDLERLFAGVAQSWGHVAATAGVPLGRCTQMPEEDSDPSI
jgi:hypothetical protein